MTTLERQGHLARPSVLGTGVVVQFVLLAAVAHTHGLGLAGWSAGMVWTVGGWLLLGRNPDGFGPADQVTLARATLAGCVAALTADLLAGAPGSPALLVVLATVGLVLDAVDGVVARRTGTASAFGARFDMEVDAALILLLSAAVAVQLGPWVLAIGGMRYAFVLAAFALPWLRAALPHSRARKVVAAWQGVTLTAAAAGVVPPWFAAAGVALSLTLLTWSFGRDTHWLHRSRQQRVPHV